MVGKMARLAVIMTFVVAVSIAAIVMLTKVSRSDVIYSTSTMRIEVIRPTGDLEITRHLDSGTVSKVTWTVRDFMHQDCRVVSSVTNVSDSELIITFENGSSIRIQDRVDFDYAAVHSAR